MKFEFDVAVCGGGTAGAAAAIASARQGAKTVVIERMGALGGTQTQAWVTPMMPNYLGDFKLDRGLNLEIVRAQSATQPPPSELLHGDVWYDPVELARILDVIAEAAGVQCLFDATLVAAVVERQTVRTIDLMTRGGIVTILAKCFIDATGDGTLSALCGAETMGGDEAGTHQPMTLRFIMGGVDLARARAQNAEMWRVNDGYFLEAGYAEAKTGWLGPKIEGAIAEGILDHDDLGYFQCFTVNGRPNEMAFNCPRIAGLDPLDPFQLSRAYQVGRAKIKRISQFMIQYIPGFEHSFVSVVAPMIGIRESRRVVGDYVLTADDHLSQAKFDDVVARNRYPIDIHLKTGLDYRRFPDGAWHDIPYRSLVVKGFDNLWVAGRCLSADFVAQSAVRIQPVCRSMGEAVGIAGALCAKEGVTSREIPYSSVANLLDLSLPE